MSEPTAAPAETVAPVETAPAKAPEAAAVAAPKVDENGVALETPKKIWKLNVNGKDVEYDASDEAKLQRDIQKVFGIEEKAKTAAQQSSEAETLLSLLQSDPKGFAKKCAAVGINAEKLATDILYEQIRKNSMTPEQRELEEYKERERLAAEQKKADEEAAKVAAVQQKTQEWAAKFEKDCEAALKNNQIPKSRLALALVAQYIDSGLAAKKEYTVEQVLPYVIRDLKEIHSSTMERLEGEDLLNYIGESLSNKIAKARVERYKKTQAVTQPAQKTQNNVSPQKADLDKILKTKGRTAYFKALREAKSEQGIQMYPGEA